MRQRSQTEPGLEDRQPSRRRCSCACPAGRCPPRQASHPCWSCAEPASKTGAHRSPLHHPRSNATPAQDASRAPVCSRPDPGLGGVSSSARSDPDQTGRSPPTLHGYSTPDAQRPPQAPTAHEPSTGNQPGKPTPTGGARSHPDQAVLLAAVGRDAQALLPRPRYPYTGARSSPSTNPTAQPTVSGATPTDARESHQTHHQQHPPPSSVATAAAPSHSRDPHRLPQPSSPTPAHETPGPAGPPPAPQRTPVAAPPAHDPAS